MSIRDEFVGKFGEDHAVALEGAATDHAGYSQRRGSDPFKWVLCICIGYECFTRPAFRAEHGITAPVEDLKRWIAECADLGSHDGDFDDLAALAGVYDEYMPRTPSEGV